MATSSNSNFASAAGSASGFGFASCPQALERWKEEKVPFVLELNEELTPPYLSIGKELGGTSTAKRLREIQGHHYSPYGSNPKDILILLKKYQDEDVDELRAVVISSFAQFLGAAHFMRKPPKNMGFPIPPGDIQEEEVKTLWAEIYLLSEEEDKKGLKEFLKKEGVKPFSWHQKEGVKLYLLIARGCLPGGFLSEEEATLWRHHTQRGYTLAEYDTYMDS